ncbi:hypothetical protein EYF80_042157 [Liparis tanakae]|uniref:Uncharacterized protein n=1 Tax=Liparis tanakae TaxID=230148 RepID=A0A4Z2G2C6_9TELE|nr:hypothetical protein EYF80_042157 [Liparis tanakae]
MEVGQHAHAGQMPDTQSHKALFNRYGQRVFLWSLKSSSPQLGIITCSHTMFSGFLGEGERCIQLVSWALRNQVNEKQRERERR